MDTLKKYQDILAQYLTEYAKIKPANLPNLDSYAVIDTTNNHFQLLQLGWLKFVRIQVLQRHSISFSNVQIKQFHRN